MININIDQPNQCNHHLLITMTFPVIQPEFLVKLPKWRPGRYELTNYEANIFDFQVFNENDSALIWNKESTHIWKVNAGKATTATIKYTFYANNSDAGGSYAGENEIYINFINCIFSIDGLTQETINLTIDASEQWASSTALKQTAKHKFVSNNIDQLYDSPLVVSPSIETHSITVNEHTFFIDLIGDHQINTERLRNDFEKFISCQLASMKTFYSEAYRFIIKIMPEKAYHGVEHFDSTVITLGPSSESHTKSFYENLIGISSHELFHHWNAKLLRPQPLQPYNLFESRLFDTGYVIEGFTTYLGDYFLYKSTVFDHDWFINELNKSLRRHSLNFGRHHQNLLQSSRDLWIDGYKNIAPHRKVSIYTEGSLFAFLLDQWLKKESRSSLIDLMQHMISEFKDNGYQHTDVIKTCQKLVSNTDVKVFVSNYLENKNGLIEGFQTLLNNSAYEVQIEAPDQPQARTYGYLLSQDHSKTIVNIDPLSDAYNHLSLSDSIISEVFYEHKAELTIIRNSITMKKTIAAGNEPYFPIYQIKLKPDYVN